MVTVTNLKKSYPGIIAVDDISFEIHRGEVFGLLGPNGAGKSTTINMIVGALAPDSGTIAIDGGGGPDNPDVRRKIGTAPQSLAIYDDLSAEENLCFFGHLYGLSGKKLHSRVDEVLDLVALTDRRKDRAANYSGGMKRRLNLACALVHDPPLLMLDEPTVGVDPQSRNLLFEKIESLRSQGRTVLYTTHYMEEAQRLCDRVAIIDHGHILDLDTVPNLLKRHGGMSMVEAEFETVPPAGLSLPGTLEDRTLRFESATPFEEIARLTTLGVPFSRIEFRRPDLENVFLNLTGRRLRD